MLLFADGFDSYVADADMSVRWARSSSMTFVSGGGHTGGGAAQCTATGVTSSAALLGSQAAGTKIRMVGWLKYPTALPINGQRIYVPCNDGGTGVWIYINGANSHVSFRDWNNNNTLATEGGANGYIKTQGVGAWIHIEVDLCISNTVGYCKVWLDGNLVINYTGSTGALSGAVTRALFCGTASQPCVWDDVMIWNDASVDNIGAGPIGAHDIQTVRPTANGNQNDWTPLAASNYQNVDEVFTDSATTYNHTITNGHIDLYAFGDVISGGKGIKIVQQVRSINTGATVGTEVGVCRTAGANYDNAAPIAISAAYLTYGTDLWYVDPNTGLAWGTSAFNAAEFGVKRNSGSVGVQHRLSQMFIEAILYGTEPANDIDLTGALEDDAGLEGTETITPPPNNLTGALRDDFGLTGTLTITVPTTNALVGILTDEGKLDATIDVDIFERLVHSQTMVICVGT